LEVRRRPVTSSESAIEILRRFDTPGVGHGFVLDEFRAMPRVECVHEALDNSRRLL